jgi:hypothetical protein
VLFDKICRHNDLSHRLTQPASLTTTGKIDPFHLTLRRDLPDDHEPFESLEATNPADAHLWLRLRIRRGGLTS